MQCANSVPGEKPFYISVRFSTHYTEVNRSDLTLRRGNVGEPSGDETNAFEVIWNDGVTDAVVVHDLDASQLRVGSVHFAAQHFVQRRSTG